MQWVVELLFGLNYHFFHLQEAKKKVEELHAEVKKQQFKWKLAGEDIERVKTCSLTSP